MVEGADAARCDHRHRHRIGNRAGEREVIAVLGAVAVHAGDEQFARAQFGKAHRMGKRIDPGRGASAMGEDFPPPLCDAARVDAADRALAAETVGDVGDKFGARHRGAVHRDLVGAREEQRARIVGAAHAAADGQRHEADFGGACDHIEQRAAPLVARRNVEEAKLVGARRVIGARGFDRIAGVAQVDEIDALHDAAVGNVEAGDDADADGHACPAAIASARSRRPS